MQCSFKITTETSYNFLAAVGVRSITHSAHSAHGGHIAAHFISLITNTSVATVQELLLALQLGHEHCLLLVIILSTFQHSAAIFILILINISTTQG